MNPTHSHTQPLSQSDDEPRIRDYAIATALVVAACASIAVAFIAIATGHAVGGVFDRIFRRGCRHVPR